LRTHKSGRKILFRFFIFQEKKKKNHQLRIPPLLRHEKKSKEWPKNSNDVTL
jgi:hypothetical protein